MTPEDTMIREGKMREIKFRGKSEDEGEWVYGFYYESCYSGAYIIEQNEIDEFAHELFISVKKETLGQYTGLKDKNGVEIYEGDIVKVWDNYKQVYSSKNGSIDDIAIPTIQVIEFWGYGFFAGDFGVGKFEIEVIGNKFDNPELLEKNRDERDKV